jgi:hypothetical protein
MSPIAGMYLTIYIFMLYHIMKFLERYPQFSSDILIYFTIVYVIILIIKTAIENKDAFEIKRTQYQLNKLEDDLLRLEKEAKNIERYYIEARAAGKSFEYPSFEEFKKNYKYDEDEEDYDYDEDDEYDEDVEYDEDGEYDEEEDEDYEDNEYDKYD